MQACAKHILVADENICKQLKEDILNGQEFEKVAEEYSECPSSRDGGSLGTFSPGTMVPEFDKVVFSGKAGEVYGPVKTQFGYHLIKIISLTS